MTFVLIAGYCAIGLVIAYHGLVRFLHKNPGADRFEAALAALVVGTVWIFTIPVALLMSLAELKEKTEK